MTSEEHQQFADQQAYENDWAEQVHLTAAAAECITHDLVGIFGFKHPTLRWESGVLHSGGACKAATTRNDRTGGLTVDFRGYGCTLLTLCHELVHCWREWEEPHHDAVDWDVCVILLEECRERCESY